MRTTIIGKSRRLSRQQRADLDYTVNWVEPVYSCHVDQAELDERPCGFCLADATAGLVMDPVGGFAEFLGDVGGK
ncbi:MAG: hypothetical protein ACR2M5_16275 [Nakamurella sp.]